MKNRGKCITCNEPIGMASFFVVMQKGRARSEHSACRRENETIKRILEWLDRCIEYQARTRDNEWDDAKIEAGRDIRADLASGAWRPAENEGGGEK